MAITNMPPMSPCAVSVVIPMYNVEKYLAECLESLLVQTLQNFEIILVNDCSTDNSRQIAENYLDKFGGRLKIYDNVQNAGAAASRNKGLILSRGEYIFFMDADDLIMANGLEKVYKIAKNFDVDVVNITGSYKISEDGQKITTHISKKTTPENEPILESNLEWRVKGLLADKFIWAPWRRLLRRDFLINNEIFFPEIIRRNMDVIWTHGILFCAKKIVHVPVTIYLYRRAENSISTMIRTVSEKINSRVNNIIHALKWIDNMMSKTSFFEQNPHYRYAILAHVAERFIGKLYKDSRGVLPSDMFLAIKEEFGKNFGEYDLVVPVLCTLINTYQKTIEENQMRIAELEKKFKAVNK